MHITEKLETILKRVEKPGRYIGEELNITRKNPDDVLIRFGFAFPDTYEIGMSYTGLQILYDILNQHEKVYCERIFAPAIDMEKIMRQEQLPLFTMETKTPVSELDVLGFTLQYEMSYTNVLNMLDLGQIPVLREERAKARANGQHIPLIVAGGPCAFNPEPLADFVDVFFVGDGEEQLPAFNKAFIEAKKQGKTLQEFLVNASFIDGVYIPEFYDVEYAENGVVKNFVQKEKDAIHLPIKRAILKDLNSACFPENPIVPLVEVVHDRAIVETFRGCTRGCRFCQAGMIYRPVRERSKDKILKLAKTQLENTGHDELALLSLSTSDHSEFEKATMELMEYCKEKDISLSLPSLRLDSFSFKVLDEIQKYRKSGLTFAVEAGTQRLRDVINKGVKEEDIYSAIDKAIDLGWRNIKLYFMIGLPTETEEDLEGIGQIVRKIIQLKKDKNNGKLGKFNVTVSVSNFVPKPFTPFQWVAQDSAEMFEKKHNYLAKQLHIKGVTFNYHDNKTSQLEAVFARGDRNLGKVLYNAWKLGCKFDGWTEHFKPDLWEKSFVQSSIDPEFYTKRQRSVEEILPWDVIDSCVDKEFLKEEFAKSRDQLTTLDCRYGCVGCGINKYIKCEMGGVYE